MFLIKTDGAVPIPQNSIIVAIPFVNESELIAMKGDARNNRAVFWTTAHPLSCAVLLSPHFRDDWCAPTSRARFNSHIRLLNTAPTNNQMIFDRSFLSQNRHQISVPYGWNIAYNTAPDWNSLETPNTAHRAASAIHARVHDRNKRQLYDAQISSAVAICDKLFLSCDRRVVFSSPSAAMRLRNILRCKMGRRSFCNSNNRTAVPRQIPALSATGAHNPR